MIRLTAMMRNTTTMLALVIKMLRIMARVAMMAMMVMIDGCRHIEAVMTGLLTSAMLHTRRRRITVIAMSMLLVVGMMMLLIMMMAMVCACKGVCEAL